MQAVIVRYRSAAGADGRFVSLFDAAIAAADGIVSHTWFAAGAAGQCCDVLLFASKQACEAFTASDRCRSLQRHPALSAWEVAPDDAVASATPVRRPAARAAAARH